MKQNKRKYVKSRSPSKPRKTKRNSRSRQRKRSRSRLNQKKYDTGFIIHRRFTTCAVPKAFI